MLRKLCKAISFLFATVVLFAIIIYNHAIFEDGSWNVDVIGLLVILTIIFITIKRIDKKMDVWEIQDKNKLLRIHWTNFKRVMYTFGAWWLLVTIDNNMEKIILTTQLFLVSLSLSWIFARLGHKEKGTLN